MSTATSRSWPIKTRTLISDETMIRMKRKVQSKASDHADISAKDRFGQRLWLVMPMFICIKEQKSSNGSGPKWSRWEEGSVMRPEFVLQNHLNMMNHGLQVLDLGIWWNLVQCFLISSCVILRITALQQSLLAPTLRPKEDAQAMARCGGGIQLPAP